MTDSSPGDESAHRPARWARAPEGRGRATVAVAGSRRTGVLGALFALAILTAFGAIRGDVVAGTAFGAVAAAILLAATLRTRLSAGPGWLAITKLLGTRWVDLTQLRGVSSRGALGGRRLLLTDASGRTIDVERELLLANPQIRAAVHAGLAASRHAGHARSREADELYAHTAERW